MGRIRKTWELAKDSWAILKGDKELVALPVMSAVTMLVVAAVFGGLVLLVGDGLSGNSSEDFDPGPFGYLLIAIAYFAVAFVGVFFNAALVAGAYQRLTGGNPTLGSALGGAFARVHRLLGWALIAATVGLILQAIEDRLGPLISNLVGAAWRVVTFLVIPVLVVEDLGAIKGLKRGAGLFKRTWGENVAAYVGFGLLGFVAALPGVIVAALLVVTGVDALVIVGVAVGVIWLLAAAAVVAALSGIFQAALYAYAVDGEVPTGFSQEALAGSFGPRRGQ